MASLTVHFDINKNLCKNEYITIQGEEVFLFYEDRGIWKRANGTIQIN